MNVVSPFVLFLAGSLCLFFIASWLLLAAVDLLPADVKLLALFIFDGLVRNPYLGPLARLSRTNYAAYSLVKQSHIPSHAIIIKSASGCSYTLVISGKEVT
jgi:hypothetical protein